MGYHRFCLSFRDVEDLLAERGIIVSHETIRLWCQKFGPEYVRKLKQRQGRLGDSWHLDEVFIRINGQRQDLWRAVDQDGDVLDILVQPRRDERAAERFFRNVTPTIAPKSRISRPARGNDTCADSNLLAKLNAFSLSTVSSRIFPRRPPLAQIEESPTLTIAILRGLADRDSGLRRLQDIQPLPLKTTPARSS